jgi:hypothetical protein
MMWSPMVFSAFTQPRLFGFWGPIVFVGFGPPFFVQLVAHIVRSSTCFISFFAVRVAWIWIFGGSFGI